MAYLNNIPQSSDQLSLSQSQILGNFQALGAIAGNINDSSASLNSNSGFNWVFLANQGATPPAGASFAAGVIGAYSATNGATGRKELYINHSVAGPTVVQTPITAYVQGGTNAANGWAYLPSGLIMAWGRATCAAPGLFNVVYGTELTGFPTFTVQTSPPLVTRIASGATTSNFIYVQSFNNAGFTARTNAVIAGTADFSWMVIGL